MGAATRTQHTAGLEVLGQCRGVEGGRHDDDLQVGSTRGLERERLGERDVTVEMPLVELVEEKSAHPVQIGITQHLTNQDSLGDKEESRT